MAKVGIVMGSDSDMPVMAQAADFLEKMGIEFEMTVISAHREPDVFFEYAKSAELAVPLPPGILGGAYELVGGSPIYRIQWDTKEQEREKRLTCRACARLCSPCRSSECR